MTHLTLAVLLDMFSHCCTGDARPVPFPFPPDVVAIAQRTPSDPEVYVRLADEAFAMYLDSPDAIDLDRFADFEEVMRVLLYYDGRSAKGLMRIAKLAAEHPDISNAGVNALAWLTNYLRLPQYHLAAKDVTPLRADLRAYLTNRTLAHNAQACLDALEERTGAP